MRRSGSAETRLRSAGLGSRDPEYEAWSLNSRSEVSSRIPGGRMAPCSRPKANVPTPRPRPAAPRTSRRTLQVRPRRDCGRRAAGGGDRRRSGGAGRTSSSSSLKMCDLDLPLGARARTAHRRALRRARGARPRLPAALLAVGRVVHARRRARDRDPVLPGAPAPRAARARIRCSRSKAAPPSGA